MTELEALHQRIHHDDVRVRDDVSTDDMRRYLELSAEKDRKAAERHQILAEARDLAGRQKMGADRPLRGVELIARGLRGA